MKEFQRFEIFWLRKEILENDCPLKFVHFVSLYEEVVVMWNWSPAVSSQMTGKWYLLNVASKCSYLMTHGTAVEPTVMTLTFSPDSDKTLLVSTKTRRQVQQATVHYECSSQRVSSVPCFISRWSKSAVYHSHLPGVNGCMWIPLEEREEETQQLWNFRLT